MEVKHEAINTKLIHTILKNFTIPNTKDDSCECRTLDKAQHRDTQKQRILNCVIFST